MKKVYRSVLFALAISASPVAAQETPADVANMIDNVTTISTSLSERVAAFSEIMAASTDGETAVRALDDMLEGVRMFQAEIGRDSTFWTDINQMLEAWSARRDDLRERSADTPRLGPIAESWQERIDMAMLLRDQIRKQSDESLALIDEIEEQREVVIALYDANLADQALSEMQAISDELGQMNEEMNAIVGQARVIAEPSNLATE